MSIDDMDNPKMASAIANLDQYLALDREVLAKLVAQMRVKLLDMDDIVAWSVLGTELTEIFLPQNMISLLASAVLKLAQLPEETT
jgi:hypothetical protein